MCGITGVFNPSRRVSLRKFYDAHLTIKHRGPDDEGFVAIRSDKIELFKGDDTIDHFKQLNHVRGLEDAQLIMGHRRLSIIDLSFHGHQPYIFDHLSMVFNGEIFNYGEIKRELIALGYSFESASDTEVVLKAFHKWGPACFNMFNGMWAIAIYDLRTDSLLLSRDRFGQKPLYYSKIDGTFVFGSEMKFIRSFCAHPFKMDEQYIKDYVDKSLSDHNNKTVWEGICEVPPGHFQIHNKDTSRTERYWNFQPGWVLKSEKEIAEAFGKLFEDAIRLRMISDVPVGSLLSGGLDSTLIVCTLYALDLVTDKEFNSFSAVFQEERYSERKYVEVTARKIPIKKNYIEPNHTDVTKYLDKILHHIEMPFRSLAILSQHKIYEYIAQETDIKVVLNGQGADEAFGGYTADLYWYITARIGQGDLVNASKMIKYLIKDRNVSALQIIGSLIKRMNGSIFKKSYYNEKSFSHITTSALREYLKYDDRNSMTYGIEARAPFMDYRLIEFAYTLDSKYKNNKHVIREYAAGLIPDEVLHRKDKMGFVSPQEDWQREHLKKDIKAVYNSLQKKDSILDMKEETLRLNRYLDTGKNWQRIWRVYCYGYWLTKN